MDANNTGFDWRVSREKHPVMSPRLSSGLCILRWISSWQGARLSHTPQPSSLVATTPAEPTGSQVRDADAFHSFWALPQGRWDLSPQPGIQPLPPAGETWNLSYRTNTEGPGESHSLAAGRTGSPSPTGNSRAIPQTFSQGNRCAHLV